MTTPRELLARYVTQSQMSSFFIDKMGIINVKSYGAVGNGVTDDTAAIQAAINSLSPGGGAIYFPKGTYIVSNMLVVNFNLIHLSGSGRASIIKNIGATSTLRFQNCERFSITELALTGNGGAYGAGATNGNAIELFNAHHSKFTNVYIEYNGGHGIFVKDGMWCCYLNACYIAQNAGDGINSITDATQLNSGQNGNNLSILNSAIFMNAGHGIAWSATALNVSGCTVESNKKSGICIDAKSAWLSTYGVNITGNYFESNYQGQIKLISSLAEESKPARTVTGANIEGNWVFSSYAGADGATALIVSEAINYYGALSQVNIGVNSYHMTGTKLTHYINIDSSRSSVYVTVIRGEGVPDNSFNIIGEATIISPRKTLCLSGMTYQKGFTFTNPYRSDNILAVSPKTCFFSIPVSEDTFWRSTNLYIETDSNAGYSVTISVQSADALSAATLATEATTTIISTTSNFLFTWACIRKVTKNKSYYVKIDITDVSGGTYMYLRDLVLETT